MKAFAQKHFLPVSIIILVSIYFLWPILSDPIRRVVEKWDGVLMVWYLNQTIAKIPDNLGSIFQANIFYPYKNVMAYSDMFIPSAFISYIPTVLTSEPTVAISTSLLFGQIITILICYFWFWEATKNKTAALISSVALGISATRMSFIMHLQMWNHEWWLFSAYLFWKYFKNGKLKYLLASGIFWGIQMWESPLGVYFAASLMCVIGIKNIKMILSKRWQFIIFLILSGVIMIPPAHAYLSVSREFNYVRTIRDAANFSPGIDNLVKGILRDGVFAGLFILLLFKNVRKKLFKEKWIIFLLMVSLILSLGPVLKIGASTLKIFGKIFVPLPYGVLYYIIPGFSAFRAPSRWLWVGLFSAAFTVSIGLTQVLKKKKNNFQKLAVFVVVILSLFPLTKKIKYYEFGNVSEYPKVYSYLKTLPNGVLLELPIYSWVHGKVASIETARMVYSLYHGKYLLGGASGFEPPSWNEVRSLYWSAFPSEEFTEHIKREGVNYILIWKDLIEPKRLDEMKEFYGNHLYEDSTHVLYKL